MTKTEKILTGILIGSILINMVFYFALSNKMNEKFEMISSSQDHLVHRVQSEMNGVYHQVHEITRETVWVVSESFEPNVETSTADTIQMDFEWSFRELADDAEVKLLYRNEGQEWLEQEAKNIGGLNYATSINLSSNGNYQYQIVSEGAMNRATEIKNIPGYLFKPTPLVPVEWGSSYDSGVNKLTWRFQQQGPYNDLTFYEVESAVAYATYANGDREEIELDKEIVGTDYEGRPVDSWVLEVENHDLFEVILRVEYNNGTVHEGEIFPDEHKYLMKVQGHW